MRNANRVLVGKLKGKRSPGRSSYRWEDNIEIDLKERRWKYADWIYFTQNGNQWQAVLNST
jgi:hypothetical protein